MGWWLILDLGKGKSPVRGTISTGSIAKKPNIRAAMLQNLQKTKKIDESSILIEHSNRNRLHPTKKHCKKSLPHDTKPNKNLRNLKHLHENVRLGNKFKNKKCMRAPQLLHPEFLRPWRGTKVDKGSNL